MIAHPIVERIEVSFRVALSVLVAQDEVLPQRFGVEAELRCEYARKSVVPCPWMHPQYFYATVFVETTKGRQCPWVPPLHKDRLASFVLKHSICFLQSNAMQSPSCEALKYKAEVV
jgi:hypothetical protein